jgi:nitrous oxidase accessory protein NosD
VNANTIDSNSMVAGVTSSGSGGSTSVVYMQGVNDLSNNIQVNNAQLQSMINVLGGSIQRSVDAAKDGDTIKVLPGLYKENVKVDKSLTIQGSGALCTIVDGQQKGPVFSIIDPKPDVTATLADMTIRKGSSMGGGGIYNDHSKLTVRNCIIREWRRNRWWHFQFWRLCRHRHIDFDQLPDLWKHRLLW